jgi:UDP-N-acetylmuramoylalanine--D-glutamate ligase
MMSTDWKQRRILILGAARQGLALARFLSSQGARVILNDQRPPEALADAQKEMADYPLQWVLGEHPLSLLDNIELVCVSGGVPLTLPIVQEAKHRGVPLSNDSQIFMEAVPCPVIGITGSAGKTTTTTLVGRMAHQAATASQQVWVGGNIGLPLIDHLADIQAQDIVVLEFSSFQLELMTTSPHVAAVLNITPNHLDRHGTLASYTAAKARILEFQQAADIAVLSRQDPGAWALAGQVKGSLVTFGKDEPPAGQTGTCLAQDDLYLVNSQSRQVLMPRSDILLRGEHNLHNVLAAFAIASAAGWNAASLSDTVRDFSGVEHRLEYIRTLNGAQWYNDSIATAPERTMAAIHSFNEPLVLLLGGRDKDLPWDSLAELIHQRVDHVVVFGEASEKILRAIGPLQARHRPYTLDQYASLEEAVQGAARVAEEGDVVLLSPGGTSYDAFIDFVERGERFRQWVKQLS